MCPAYWTKEQICFLGTTSPQRSGCSTHWRFRKSVRSLARQRSTSSPQIQLSLPNLFFEEQGCVVPRMAQPPPVCFSPDRSDPSGNQASQGAQAQIASGGPALEEPSLDLRAISAANSSSVAHSPEAGPPLSGEQNDLAPPARAVGPASLASRWESIDLPEKVLNTISQARAPSTRRLYALNPLWHGVAIWQQLISTYFLVILKKIQYIAIW